MHGVSSVDGRQDYDMVIPFIEIHNRRYIYDTYNPELAHGERRGGNAMTGRCILVMFIVYSIRDTSSQRELENARCLCRHVAKRPIPPVFAP